MHDKFNTSFNKSNIQEHKSSKIEKNNMFNRLHSLIYVTQDQNRGHLQGKVILLLIDDGCSDSSDVMHEG